MIKINLKEENNMDSQFKKWLSNIKFKEDTQLLIEQNMDLFDLVFQAGYKQQYKDRLFKNMGVFHDVVVDATDKDLSHNELEYLYYCLPDFWQENIEKYGFYALKDDLYTYFENEGLPKMFEL